MKKWILLALLATPVFAQTPTQVQRATLLSAYDLDGEAADDNQIVTVIALTDSATFTVAAQPDVCRLVDITVTDADSSITAGVLTVTGTDCFGDARVATFTFAAGGSGVKTLTVTGYPSRGAYFSTVSAVGTGVLTGEGGGDTVTVGYTTNSANGWAMYGSRMPDLPGAIKAVNPFRWTPVARSITTSGANSTTVTGVDSDLDAFARVSTGSLIMLTMEGTVFERKVATKTDDDTITVNSEINIPAAGVTYSYKSLFESTDPWDLVMVPVHGWRQAMFTWSVDANANTGGVVTNFQCTEERVEFPTGRWVQLDTTTVASAGTQVDTSETVNLELIPYQYCRFGLSFGTGDDADAAAEDINLTLSLMR